MYKKLISILSLLVLMSVGVAKNCVHDENVIVIIANNNGGDDKSTAISASIDGHTLTVVFLENLGQVSISITNDLSVTTDYATIPTPNGYIFYVTNAGNYVITFTLANGDEYYGCFTVTE